MIRIYKSVNFIFVLALLGFVQYPQIYVKEKIPERRSLLIWKH